MKRSACFILLAPLCLGQGCPEEVLPYVVSPFMDSGIPSGVYLGDVAQVVTVTTISYNGDDPVSSVGETSFPISKEFIGGVPGTVEGWPIRVGSYITVKQGETEGLVVVDSISVDSGLVVVKSDVTVTMTLAGEAIDFVGRVSDTYKYLGNGQISYVSAMNIASIGIDEGEVHIDIDQNGILARWGME